MPTKIQRWGNSQGIRVPKSVLADARLQVGDVVDVRAVDGTLVVTRARSRRGRASLEDLVAALPGAGQHGEADWGRPEGDEV
ncbi:MAG: AbrB/MazE/SpoVT family DNA-binding domain-containing protein [Trueperaceae bacterium]|nr:AbrB/MazE/SpoVT family DNA-binding domain-containing protein [Trueperaceae bacterium]